MASDWPFKGKPRTNEYAQAVFFITCGFVWGFCLLAWPALTTNITACVLLVWLFKSSYRRIRNEWFPEHNAHNKEK